MTGSTLDLLLLSVVVAIVVVAPILLVFYADAHLAWRRPERPGRRGRHHRRDGSQERPPLPLPGENPAAPQEDRLPATADSHD